MTETIEWTDGDGNKYVMSRRAVRKGGWEDGPATPSDLIAALMANAELRDAVLTALGNETCERLGINVPEWAAQVRARVAAERLLATPPAKDSSPSPGSREEPNRPASPSSASTGEAAGDELPEPAPGKVKPPRMHAQAVESTRIASRFLADPANPPPTDRPVMLGELVKELRRVCVELEWDNDHPMMRLADRLEQGGAERKGT